VYVAAAIPLSSWLGTQGLAVATTVASITVFTALLIAIARQVPEIGLVRTTGELAFYAVLGGAAMLGTVAVLNRLGWTPSTVALTSLVLGGTAYTLALWFGGDRTFRTLLDLARASLGRGPKISAARTDRSSKAPPSQKID
jgi:hypothetical protein